MFRTLKLQRSDPGPSSRDWFGEHDVEGGSVNLPFGHSYFSPSLNLLNSNACQIVI